MDKRIDRKVILLGVLFLLLFPVKVMAKPLDEIQDEIIHIQTREDGSLDIQYHIEWKVLDSTSEGPLNWVKIGIPNAYVEDIQFSGESIEDAYYYDSGGDYVRIDLNRDYEAGEVVEMNFSIHQHRMYEEKNGNYSYQFTPGWFEDMEIRRLAIFWEADSQVTSDMELSEDKYISVFENLSPGERVTVKMEYPMGKYHFQDDYAEKADAEKRQMLQILLTVAGVFGPLGFVAIIFSLRNKKKWKGDYEKNRGFGGVYTGTGRNSRGSGGCACACACACAGGGRAGCSRKDFYPAMWKRKQYRADREGEDKSEGRQEWYGKTKI